MVDSSDGINETEGRGICRFLCKNSNLSNHVYYNGGRVDENFSCLLSLFFIMNEIIISSFFKNKKKRVLFKYRDEKIYSVSGV